VLLEEIVPEYDFGEVHVVRSGALAEGALAAAKRRAERGAETRYPYFGGD
jgi:hypothetical protein